MDGSRFDQLARSLAGGRSRRSLLNAALGGALAVVGVGRAEAAAYLRTPGEICRKNGDCASGLCGARDATGRQYCQCGAATECPQPKAGDVCHIATCTAGACGIGPNTGAACNDGNLCTTNDTCNANGQCVGTAVVCPAPDQCHLPGTCDPATGTCSNPVNLGAQCNDGDICTTGETCQADGTCGGGSPVVCPPVSNGSSFCGPNGCDFTCDTGYQPCNGTCIPNTVCCACTGGACGYQQGRYCGPAGSETTCQCIETTGSVCTCVIPACDLSLPCDTTSCPSGYACIARSDCCSGGGFFCLQTCNNGAQAASIESLPDDSGDGTIPTIGG